MSFVTLWSHAFAVTLLIELLVAVPLLGRGRPLLHRVGAVAAAQLLSHPSVWFVWPELGLQRTAYLLLAETWAVVTELLLYRLIYTELAWSRVLAVSALANGASLAVATLVQ